MNQNDAIVPVDAQFKQFLDGVNAPKTRFKSGAEALADIRGMDRGRTPAGPARAKIFSNPPNMRANQTAFGNNFDSCGGIVLGDSENFEAIANALERGAR